MSVLSYPVSSKKFLLFKKKRIVGILIINYGFVRKWNEYVNNGESEEEEEHFEELEYLQNTFHSLKPYDFEPERTSTSDPSNK